MEINTLRKTQYAVRCSTHKTRQHPIILTKRHQIFIKYVIGRRNIKSKGKVGVEKTNSSINIKLKYIHEDLRNGVIK